MACRVCDAKEATILNDEALLREILAALQELNRTPLLRGEYEAVRRVLSFTTRIHFRLGG